MTSEEVLTQARQVASGQLPFILATVDEKGEPQARWMAGLALDESLTFAMMTMPESRKITQILARPAAQLVFHTPDYMRVATLSGACEISHDLEIKQRLWDTMPDCDRFVSGPEDPRFGLVIFRTRRVELLDISQTPPALEQAEI